MSKKYTLITGASSGIGEATAKLFAEKGKNLILIARRGNLLKKLKEELSAKSDIDIILKEFDLTDIMNLSTLYESLKQYKIELWINNAGIGLMGNVFENPLDKVINMVNLNVQAVTVLSTLYVKDYKDIEGSQLINVASAAGYIVSPLATTYSATKFYVTSFTEGLDLESRANGSKLRAKVLCPAATSTEFIDIATGGEKYDYFQNFSTSEKVAEQLYELYKSDSTVGIVNFEDSSFKISEPKFTNLY